MRHRIRSLIAAIVALASGLDGPLAARATADQSHTVVVVNHTDACVHVRMFRDEAGAPTTPPTKQHDLAPKARFSVSVAELPKDVWVEADIMSDTDCTTKKVAATGTGYARGGGVIIAGKKSKYILITEPVKDVPQN